MSSEGPAIRAGGSRAGNGPVRFVLVPGPRTGAGLWAGVRDALHALGQRTLVMRLTDTRTIYPPYWLTQAASVAATLPEDGQVVLVAHGDAGVLLPVIERLNRNRDQAARTRACLFVDCDLPESGRSRFDLFEEPAAAAALREAAGSGWLPRWSDAEIEPFVPDAALRQAFLAQLPHVPLALYEEWITLPLGWPDVPCGYLEITDGHADAVCRARANGWPVASLPGHRFLPLTAPARVARGLLDLAAVVAEAPAAV